MFNKLIHILLLFYGTLSFSQQILKGKVNNISDVDGIHVYNQTGNKYTITNKNGEFEIEAKINDVIFFSAVHYQLTSIILTKEKLKEGVLVTLQDLVTELDEVYIGYQLTGNLALDAKHIETTPYVDFNAQFKGIDFSKIYDEDAQSMVKNEVMPELGGGVNLIPIVKSLAKMVAGSKKKKATPIISQHYLTLGYLKQHFGVQFLIKDLQLKEENFERFVQFCQYDETAKRYTLASNHFMLVERLLQLRKQFE